MAKRKKETLQVPCSPIFRFVPCRVARFLARFLPQSRATPWRACAVARSADVIRCRRKYWRPLGAATLGNFPRTDTPRAEVTGARRFRWPFACCQNGRPAAAGSGPEASMYSAAKRNHRLQPIACPGSRPQAFGLTQSRPATPRRAGKSPSLCAVLAARRPGMMSGARSPSALRRQPHQLARRLRWHAATLRLRSGRDAPATDRPETEESSCGADTPPRWRSC
jgi:hypothetical protein